MINMRLFKYMLIILALIVWEGLQANDSCLKCLCLADEGKILNCAEWKSPTADCCLYLNALVLYQHGEPGKLLSLAPDGYESWMRLNRVDEIFNKHYHDSKKMPRIIGAYGGIAETYMYFLYELSRKGNKKAFLKLKMWKPYLDGGYAEYVADFIERIESRR
jgi:hypothetical protein